MLMRRNLLRTSDGDFARELNFIENFNQIKYQNVIIVTVHQLTNARNEQGLIDGWQ